MVLKTCQGLLGTKVSIACVRQTKKGGLQKVKSITAHAPLPRLRPGVLLPDLTRTFLSESGSKNPPFSKVGSNPPLFRPPVIPVGRPILLCDNTEELGDDGILEDARTVTFECDRGSCGNFFMSFCAFPLYENGRSRGRNSPSEEGVGDPVLLEPMEERFG